MKSVLFAKSSGQKKKSPKFTELAPTVLLEVYPFFKHLVRMFELKLLQTLNFIEYVFRWLFSENITSRLRKKSNILM